MINGNERPCFGPGRCVFRRVTTNEEVSAMTHDNYTWYVANSSPFRTYVLLYRERTKGEA